MLNTELTPSINSGFSSLIRVTENLIPDGMMKLSNLLEALEYYLRLNFHKLVT